MNESRAHASVQRRRVPRLRSMVCIAIAGMLSLLSSQSHAVTATYRYDGLGRLVKVSYASGEFIEYVYDAAGNRTMKKVGPSSTAPVAVDDSGSFAAEYNVFLGFSTFSDCINVLANDSAPSGGLEIISYDSAQTLVASVTINGSSICIEGIAAPNPMIITYTIEDSLSQTDEGTVTINFYWP